MLMKPKKLEQEVVTLLEARLNDEYSAHYFYRAASNYCRNLGYTGAEKFFSEEASQELEHAKGIENYLADWNVNPSLKPISSPEKFTGYVDIFEKAYEIEGDLLEEYESTSKKIFNVCLAAFDFLQTYRKIQDASVAEYATFLNQFALIGEDTEDLFEFDQLMLKK